MSNSVSPQLVQLAAQLADWAAPATGTLIYLYGSRVRGDHRPDSDIDIAIEWPNLGAADAAWWSANNQEEFASINATLGNRTAHTANSTNWTAFGAKFGYGRERSATLNW